MTRTTIHLTTHIDGIPVPFTLTATYPEHTGPLIASALRHNPINISTAFIHTLTQEHPMDHHDPATRREDPETSRAAARSVANPDVLRSRVYQIMTDHGGHLTHDEIIYHYQSRAAARDWPIASDQGIRSRVAELHADGWVERDDPATARNARGRKVHQWRAVTDPDEAQQNRHTRIAEDVEGRTDGGERRHDSQVRYATTTEHLDALPIDSVLILTGHYPTVFQQTHVGRWATLGQSARTPSEGITLPARILYIPADVDIDLDQFPTTPEDQ